MPSLWDRKFDPWAGFIVWGFILPWAVTDIPKYPHPYQPSGEDHTINDLAKAFDLNTTAATKINILHCSA